LPDWFQQWQSTPAPAWNPGALECEDARMAAMSQEAARELSADSNRKMLAWLTMLIIGAH
jgi:hypothetical protein